MRFEFGKDYFDRIDIGTVWWLVEEPKAMLAKGFGGLIS